MATNRHSYVAFYPSDWLAGTARMTRLHKSVYFDICCYNWDTARSCPTGELPLMLGDLPNWSDLVDDLVRAGKLIRGDDGSLTNPKAMEEAEKALELWSKKSVGGKAGASKTNAKSGSGDGSGDGTPAGSGDGSSPKRAGTPAAEPEPDTLPNGKAAFAADLVKLIFDMGVEILVDAGSKPASARAMIGKWRRDYSDARLREALFDCKAKAITDPVAWIPKRMGNPSAKTELAEMIEISARQAANRGPGVRYD